MVMVEALRRGIWSVAEGFSLCPVSVGCLAVRYPPARPSPSAVQSRRLPAEAVDTVHPTA
jgi:hypothetical protein